MCVYLHVSDLTESVIPKWMFETGAVYLHGYDKEGNKLCMYMFFLQNLHKILMFDSSAFI